MRKLTEAIVSIAARAEQLRAAIEQAMAAAKTTSNEEAAAERENDRLLGEAKALREYIVDPPTDWTTQAIRVLDIVREQTRALPRPMLMQSFQQTHEEGRTEEGPAKRRGTYWGIKTKIGAYGVVHLLTDDNKRTLALQHIRTRLHEFAATGQGQLINWGYARADAGMRKYVHVGNTASAAWPIAEFPPD